MYDLLSVGGKAWLCTYFLQVVCFKYYLFVCYFIYLLICLFIIFVSKYMNFCIVHWHCILSISLAQLFGCCRWKLVPQAHDKRAAASKVTIYLITICVKNACT